MTKYIKVSKLSFSFFPSHRPLLFDDVSLRFSLNSLHFIRGKNGSGKSTLFRIMKGNLFQSEWAKGTIFVDGSTYDLSDNSDRSVLRSIIRLVPQNFDAMLADKFTFTKNLQLANMPRYPHVEPLGETYSIPRLVKRFGINFSVPVERLSGGQRQILAILMALQKPTSLLLLDEPTAALDDRNADMVIRFLQELIEINPALTVIVICHDKELVEAYAQDHYYEIKVNNTDRRMIKNVRITS